MGFPIVYRRQGEKFIASYDFFDQFSGRGYKILKCGAENRTGGSSVLPTDYMIAANEFWSDPFITRLTNGNTNGVFTRVISAAFVFAIEKPLIIQGKSVLNVPMAMKRLSGSGNTSVFASCAILHNTTVMAQSSGAVETQNLNAAGNFNGGRIQTFNFDIDRRKIKKGDTLTVLGELWGDVGAGNSELMLGHDPKNRQSASNNPYPDQSSVMDWHLPVVVT